MEAEPGLEYKLYDQELKPEPEPEPEPEPKSETDPRESE
jgi:hypothetical protein